ncbi:hypothetical protein VN97_g3768 [Penicillium thymicola]|uniref:Uncharacterized protein n=1 Tax=Penicillium thymicola TaxID=293382 RepID=A0AAI9TLV0_PENTH|nr:hypothetical protein VN97_g3768 [Penicillium thymicola]
MSSLRPQLYPDVLETTLNDQPENLPTHKKLKFLHNESDEGSTAESSESEINETQSKTHHQNAKRKDYVKHKGKGKRMSLDSEGEDNEDSEDSKVEDDESSPVNFNPTSKTQCRNTKQKATKRNRHNRHNKNSTSHGVRIGRDSPFYTGNKPSSSRARYQNTDHNRGVKRGRKQNVYQDDSTEESADESSGAEINAASSRTNHGKAKGKRLGDPGEVADTLDNESDREEEVKRRLARAYAKSASVKNKSQTANHKKLDKTNELAESPDKDLVRNALGGLTLGGEADAPKTDGRAPRAHAKSTPVKMPVKTKSQSGNRKKVDKTSEFAESLDKDLVGGAMHGLTLEGAAPKTNGRATKTTKEKHNERADPMHEENDGSEGDEADV